jgi:LPS O-antigen subunit length determinant protein (WzzB/FepE family)
MTEKEIPLSSASYQDQNFKHEPEDEVNLLDLLGFLVRKKVFIFSTVSICFVLSIFYAFSTTLIYRANIGFLAPEKRLTSFFPDTLYEVLPNVSRSVCQTRHCYQLGAFSIQKNYMINKFVSEVQSYSNQEKVFMEGKFHERFVVKNPKIDIKKEIVQEIYRSIHVRDVEGLSDKVVDFEMNGVNPELASDYLNALADWVKNKVELDIQESIQKGVEAQRALLSVQLNSRITFEHLKYEDEIRDLKDNIKIAKNLGILGNNFNNFIPDISSWRVPKREGNIIWPTWYLYGQRALEQKLNLMERRGVSSQYDKETSELIIKIEQLSSIDLSKINFDTVIISQPSIPPVDPINDSKITIILTGITLGLIIGVLMAFLSLVKIQLKKRLKLFPPQLK